MNIILYFAIPLSAALAFSSCSTTSPSQRGGETPLHLITTRDHKRYYDLQPLKSGEKVQWYGATDESGLCHGKGTEWHCVESSDSRTWTYVWDGTYVHGKAEGPSTVKYIDTMTARQMIYNQGRIVSQGNPVPLSDYEQMRVHKGISDRDLELSDPYPLEGFF